MKRLITFLVACTFFSNVQATHIIGGDFSVQYLSGNNFLAVLRLYRDCSPDNAGFDRPIRVSVFDQLTNSHLTELDFQFTEVIVDNAELGNACFTPNICMEIGTFIEEINLPDNPNGYYITWERCCRSSQSANLVTPNISFVFTLDVPDPALFNSSPMFNPFPTEAYLCVNSQMEIDFGATDVDGDSLVYSLTDPLQGAATIDDPMPSNISPKPYATAEWQQGYSTYNQIGGTVAMTIDPETGVIHGQPTAIGFFTIAVKVEEYRDGVKIGEIRREVLLESTACGEWTDESEFSFNINELTVQFTDLSESTSGWNWDFGDGNSSTEPNPEHTYTEEGVYVVTLTTDQACLFGLEVDLINTGIESFENVGIRFMPNPANNVLHLQLPSNIGQLTSGTFLDMNGGEVKTFDLNHGGRFDISLGDMDSGIYILVLENKFSVPLFQQKISVVH